MNHSIFKLLHVISKLTPSQKEVVSDIGFSSILDLQCSTIPMNLLKWLADHYDTVTNTVHFATGFSFALNAQVVRTILDIPISPTQVQCIHSDQSFNFFKSQIISVGSTPSVDELVASLTPNTVGDQFARTFMLLVLSSFLCPNGKNLCSSKFYSAILSVPQINQQDWCSLVVNYLNSSIQRY